VDLLEIHNIIVMENHLHYWRIFEEDIELERPEIQEEFKQILEFAIQKGNENMGITVQEFVNELANQLKPLVEKANS